MRVTARRLIRGTSHRSQMQVTNRRRRAVALSLQPSGPALSPRRPKSLASSLLSSFHERRRLAVEAASASDPILTLNADRDVLQSRHSAVCRPDQFLEA
jgi:hypothetical protein